MHWLLLLLLLLLDYRCDLNSSPDLFFRIPVVVVHVWTMAHAKLDSQEKDFVADVIKDSSEVFATG